MDIFRCQSSRFIFCPSFLLPVFDLVPFSVMASWPHNGACLKGVVPPIVTPLLGIDEIDIEGTRRLLEHILRAKVAGIFVLGTTGEFSSLSLSLRCDFIRLCCNIVKERVPVLVGISDSVWANTIALARVSKESGATAVVLTTPYYFPMEQPEVLRYVEQVLNEVELPVMLYNMPGLTKVWLEVETLGKLATNSKIVGIKDSIGDLDYFAKICQLKQVRSDWSIFMGPEHLVAKAVSLGADGGVNGGANVLPDLFVAACDAALNGNEEECQTKMSQVNAFQAIYKVGSPGFRFVTATKSALEHLGICSDFVAPPLLPNTDEEKKEIGRILSEI